MSNVSTNPYERAARTRKSERIADTLEISATLSAWTEDLNDVADAAAEMTDHEWETLERLAGTRPQKTQDLPASRRTRQRAVNALRVRQRRRERALLA